MTEEVNDQLNIRVRELIPLIVKRGIKDEDLPDFEKPVKSYKYSVGGDKPDAFSVDLTRDRVLTAFPDTVSKCKVEDTFGYLKGVLPENSLVMVEVQDRSKKPTEFKYREATIDEVEEAINIIKQPIT